MKRRFLLFFGALALASALIRRPELQAAAPPKCFCARTVSRRQTALNGDGLRVCCLELTGAGEEFPFGPETSVFKVGGKIFVIARLHAEPLTVSLKIDPDLGEQRFGAPSADDQAWGEPEDRP